MIQIEDGEITYPQDKHLTVQLTLFLLANLTEIAGLDEQEIENVAGCLERVFRGQGNEVIKEFREKEIDTIYKDIGIKRIK